MQSRSSFGRLRTFFWPIESFELKKVVPLLLMFFCITFNYTILRDTRDTLLVTAPGSGAEAIPFIKVWCVIPITLLFVIGYAKFSNILSKQGLFFCTLAPFVLFYLLFAFVLYPNRETLHPVASADALQSLLPAGMKGLVALYRNWAIALFYVMAELWGPVMLSLTFWGFANEITSVEEAKRFYPLFGIGASLSSVFAGPITMKVAQIRERLPPGTDCWQVSLKYLMSFVFISALLLSAFYVYVRRGTPRNQSPTLASSAKEMKKAAPKPKLSLKESFAFLIRNRYLAFLALLVFSYNMCINLIEISWKNQLRAQFADPSSYGQFMGGFSTCIGILSVLMMLFLSSNLTRRFGWLTTALITPVVLLLTGAGFFQCVLFKENMSGLAAMLGTHTAMLAVLFGAAQNMLSKACKYSLFDPTKEMAFIPLDEEAKVKGKAAIDVFGSRLGKSAGSLVQQALLLALGTMGAIIPYVAVLLFGIIGLWIFAACALNKRFTALTSKENLETEPINA